MKTKTKTKALQLFSDEYLKDVGKLTPEQILTFLDEFRRLYAGRNQRTLKRVT